jgi:hypothetical protein
MPDEFAKKFFEGHFFRQDYPSMHYTYDAKEKSSDFWS